ncbi:hypothetical protein AKJ16_DCAP20054 [Drosera capensis]
MISLLLQSRSLLAVRGCALSIPKSQYGSASQAFLPRSARLRTVPDLPHLGSDLRRFLVQISQFRLLSLVFHLRLPSLLVSSQLESPDFAFMAVTSFVATSWPLLSSPARTTTL